jgi:predicted alpha-1,2-mannosidase
VGVSRTDIGHAQAAFREEVKGRSFGSVQAQTRKSWTKALGVVRAELPECDLLTSFYTGLYHSMLGPTLVSNTDGTYRLQSREKGKNPPEKGRDIPLNKLGTEMPEKRARHQLYSSFSLWDTYRGLHPLMNLVHPEKSKDFADSLVAMYDAWGYLPRWPLFGSPSTMMEGDPGTVVLAEMALQGTADRTQALRVLKKVRTATDLGELGTTRAELPKWMEARTEPVDVGSSAYTQEAIAEHCVSRLAGAVLDHAAAATFRKRAAYLAYVGSSRRMLSRPRHPMKQVALAQLTEGGEQQYQWSLPFELAKQEKIVGGESSYAAALDDFFSEHGYDASNEVTMHVPYLYSAAGEPSKTADQIDKVVKQNFLATPAGLPGNDDMGAMSTWLVLSVLGIYPVDPCSNEFVLGRPFVEKATLLVPGGTVQIRVHDQSVRNKYVKAAEWNGRALKAPKVKFSDLKAGGVLELWMTADKAKLSGIWAGGLERSAKAKKSTSRARADLAAEVAGRWRKRTRRGRGREEALPRREEAPPRREEAPAHGPAPGHAVTWD